MIHDIYEDKLFNLSQEDWDDIIERYFEADTSEDEERLLLRFLATPQANDIRFNEIKKPIKRECLFWKKSLLRVVSPYSAKSL